MHAMPCGEPEGKAPNFSPLCGNSPGKTGAILGTTVWPVRAFALDRPTFVITGGSGLGLHLDGDRNGHVAIEVDGELIRAHLLDHLTDELPPIDLEPDLHG